MRVLAASPQRFSLIFTPSKMNESVVRQHFNELKQNVPSLTKDDLEKMIDALRNFDWAQVLGQPIDTIVEQLTTHLKSALGPNHPVNYDSQIL